MSYTYGDKLITEVHGPLNFSSPDKTIWKTLDDLGRLIEVEIDFSTSGYAQERTTYTWSDAGDLLEEIWDGDANDTADATMTHHYDKYGNRLRSVLTHGADFPADTTDPLEPKANRTN